MKIREVSILKLLSKFWFFWLKNVQFFFYLCAFSLPTRYTKYSSILMWKLFPPSQAWRSPFPSRLRPRESGRRIEWERRRRRWMEQKNPSSSIHSTTKIELGHQRGVDEKKSTDSTPFLRVCVRDDDGSTTPRRNRPFICYFSYYTYYNTTYNSMAPDRVSNCG